MEKQEYMRRKTEYLHVYDFIVCRAVQLPHVVLCSSYDLTVAANSVLYRRTLYSSLQASLTPGADLGILD